jgi:pimeloyl-ACP methyl ester carboxylesterase
MGLNSRYAGSDTVLLMERVLQDLGAGVKFMRERGYGKVLLIGSSGGGALSAFYQSQAESFTATHLVDGDPSGVTPDDLPPADGIVLTGAHEGRSSLLAKWLDPSVLDERDPLGVDPELDMFDPRHPVPYTPEFLARFRQGQVARRDRIEAWVLQRLALLRSTPGAPRDQTFIMHRTHADPRCVDLTLDANDRKPGSVWGSDARAVNYSANAMARVTSLTAFLSQWSSRSRADGPTNLARTSVPALHLAHTADQSTFPSTRDAWQRAGGDRIRNVDLKGGDHYLLGRPELVQQAADAIADWAEAVLV